MVNDASIVIRLSTENIRLPMDLVESRILHVYYTTDSVDSKGKTNGITPFSKL